MKTMSFNVEIKEENKEDGKLKDDFKLNAEVNFMKSILDLIKEGEDLTILNLLYGERQIEVETDVEVIDPDTKEKKILKDKVKKDCYSCTGLLRTHEYKQGQTKSPVNELTPTMLKDKKIGEGR